MDTKLKYAPFVSQMSSTFWNKFEHLKLDIWGLNDDDVNLYGFYGPNEIPNSNPIMILDHSSFSRDPEPYHGTIRAPAKLMNVNTSDQFKELDKNELMKKMGNSLIGNLISCDEGIRVIAEDPRILASFFMLCYPDLKQYRFIYWYAFPAVSTVESNLVSHINPVERFSDKFFHEQEKEVISQGFFWISESLEYKKLSELTDIVNLKKIWFAYVDPCNIPESPGWVLRNYLAFIIRTLNLKTGTNLNILSFGTSLEKCRAFEIQVHFEPDWLENIKFIGWERNEKGNFGAKQVNLKQTLDPIKIAENAVDFNLKLMKWRLFPDFNLDLMHKTKCLLLGAGTLGCHVARVLLGWGIRNIDFVDNGQVSFSNPVRQSLYTFQDCLGGGKSKAEAAAANIKNIFPGANSTGYNIMIGMPGHPVSEATLDKAKEDFKTLQNLVQAADVVFLLTDTREGRWLPTLLGAAHDKIVINGALGFDSYVVMRHGTRKPVEEQKSNLGCYFCSDVVAPADSTRDRTLDQQCTVTRPGISMMAAAYAVELMAAILHHPLREEATPQGEDPDSPLGCIPHTIRGFLSSGKMIMPAFQAFDKCTACSPKILSAYKEKGFDFVREVLNNPPEFLEQISGLDKLKADTFDFEADILELSDEED